MTSATCADRITEIENLHSLDSIDTELKYSWAVGLGPFKLGQIVMPHNSLPERMGP